MEMIFSKQLSNTDVFKDLSLPTGHLHHLPIISDGQQAVEFVATDASTGIPWNFTYIIRKGKYLNPVLRSKGWKPFVRSKNLEVGDKITLYKSRAEPTGETQFWVAAQKQVKLFSATIGYSTVEIN